jgi:hypothetical protein
MKTPSDYLREKAERAERLARMVADEKASKALFEMSKEYRYQAREIEVRRHARIQD